MSETMMPAQLIEHEDGALSDPDGMVPPEEVLAAERAALGGMLMNPALIADVLGVYVRPEQFFRPAHAVLARTIAAMAEAGKPVDAVMLVNELDPTELQRIGGAAYVHTLLASVPTATAGNVTYYAEIVAQHARKRATIRAGMRLQQLGKGHDPDTDAGVLTDRVRSIIDEYESEAAGAAAGPEPIGADFDDWLAEKLDGREPVTYPTGLSDLDAITGVRPGELLVVAARPSIGKTLLALRLAVRTAQQGSPVLFVSLEMTRAELLDRIVAAVCRIEHEHLRAKTLTDEDRRRLAAHRDELRSLPLYVEDSSEMTMGQIRALARDYQRHQQVEMTVIDYLGLLRPEQGAKAAESRERQVAEMSGGSKSLAKELQMPVVLVAQINRGAEHRADKRPQLSDLRESGAIEADANQVWLLHRPEFTAPEEEKMHPDNHPGEVEINVAKNRGGRTGAAWFAFRPHHQDVSNLGPRE